MVILFLQQPTSFSNPTINQEDEEANQEEIIGEELEDQLVASTDGGNDAVYNFKTVKTVHTTIFQICISVNPAFRILTVLKKP